jgi:hypothetical protein
LILAAETKRMPLASKIVRSQTPPNFGHPGPTPDPSMLPVLTWVVESPNRGEPRHGLSRSSQRPTQHACGVAISTIPLPIVADQPLLDIHASTIVERDS